MRNLILLLSILFYTSITVKGQIVSELQVGDTVNQNIPLKMVNATSTKRTLQDYRGKWLIIDFWATYCQACINAVPHLNDLQSEFAKDLNILMVTTEKANYIKSFIEINRFLKGNKLPSVVEDTILQKTFPHIIIPHEIWIDPEGVIRAITGNEEITADNIRSMVQGETKKLKSKSDNLTWSVEDAPSIDSLNLYSSTLQKYVRGTPSGAKFSSEETKQNINRVYLFNNIPLKMFYSTFSYIKKGVLGNINEKSVIFEIADSLNYYQYANKHLKPVPFYPKRFPYMKWKNQDEWIKDNLFNYELRLSEYVSKEKVLDYIFSDLNRFFPIKAKIEKRKVFCWALRCVDSTKLKLRSAGGAEKSILNKSEIGVNNKTVEAFLNLLSLSPSADHILDETGIDYPVDIIVDFSSSPLLNEKMGLAINSPIDMNLVKKFFNENGLDLKPTESYVEMLVIYDH